MIPKGFNKVGEKDGWEFHQATFAVMMPLGGFTPVTFTIIVPPFGPVNVVPFVNWVELPLY